MSSDLTILVGNTPDSKEEILRKKGAKLRSDAQRRIRFIGQDVAVPYLNRVEAAAVQIANGNDDFAELGEAYASSTYQADPSSKDRSYEAVYGDNDFSASVGDPQVQLALDQVFGDTSVGAAGTQTGLSESDLVTVLGRSSALPNVPSLPERGELAARAQSALITIPDESTKGIRGVFDPEAPIEPII